MHELISQYLSKIITEQQLLEQISSCDEATKKYARMAIEISRTNNYPKEHDQTSFTMYLYYIETNPTIQLSNEQIQAVLNIQENNNDPSYLYNFYFMLTIVYARLRPLNYQLVRNNFNLALQQLESLKHHKNYHELSMHLHQHLAAFYANLTPSQLPRAEEYYLAVIEHSSQIDIANHPFADNLRRILRNTHYSLAEIYNSPSQMTKKQTALHCAIEQCQAIINPIQCDHKCHADLYKALTSYCISYDHEATILTIFRHLQFIAESGFFDKPDFAIWARTCLPYSNEELLISIATIILDSSWEDGPELLNLLYAFKDKLNQIANASSIKLLAKPFSYLLRILLNEKITNSYLQEVRDDVLDFRNNKKSIEGILAEVEQLIQRHETLFSHVESSVPLVLARELLGLKEQFKAMSAKIMEQATLINQQNDEIAQLKQLQALSHKMDLPSAVDTETDSFMDLLLGDCIPQTELPGCEVLDYPANEPAKRKRMELNPLKGNPVKKLKFFPKEELIAGVNLTPLDGTQLDGEHSCNPVMQS